MERSPAHQALLNYQQADEDGVMVLVSRQAIHEVSDQLDAAQIDWSKVGIALLGDSERYQEMAESERQKGNASNGMILTQTAALTMSISMALSKGAGN